ncbi:MAG: hydratase [Oscillospiraceae bacterium]|nr:hydratase [Oscillospiraceae bacterium]
MPMVEYSENGVFIKGGAPVPATQYADAALVTATQYADAAQRPSTAQAPTFAQDPSAAREKTMAYKILRAHDKGAANDCAANDCAANDPAASNTNTSTNTSTNDTTGSSANAVNDPAASLRNTGNMRLVFDALVSHDITYVGIIQTARASGMTEFPLPYALTNCHNSLCAVGGTINEDDHAFGLSAAKKYGGIFVPANHAVIHQYAREKLAGCGKMILGSDSHTRYGCYGTLGIGEGGGELAKQLLKNTYDVDAPEVTLVWLEGTPPRGVGPHDVALALVKETFPHGKVKNKVLEFAGPGIGALSMDFRIGIDVMTTETSCLSSIWETDDEVRKFYDNVGRPEDYRELAIEDGAYYDSLVKIDLSAMEAMIALPFHPSKAVTIHDLQKEPARILKEAQDECNKELSGQVQLDLLQCINENGAVLFEQGVIVGCAGGMYENISEAADILRGKSVGDGYFELSVYPSSTPISLAITRDGISETLIECGAVMKPAFCGPCFGAGDTPAHNTLSVRHATRNFANREGSKPSSGQIASVALMDARSIAATAANGGVLTAATDIEYEITPRVYKYDGGVYEKRCYDGFGRPDPTVELRLGPNITDWPDFAKPEENLLLRLCAVIRDEVTTTDELIPSGETSSYRSNPVALSEFALSRRVPSYVADSKATRSLEDARRNGTLASASGSVDSIEAKASRSNLATPSGHSDTTAADPTDLATEALAVLEKVGGDTATTSIGSCIFAKKPGDGSAREQAASCQKVLGGLANICYEYATKRYRSNCINWGIVPFTISNDEPFEYNTGDWIYAADVRSAILSGIEKIPAKTISKGAVRDITLECRGLTDDERIILTEGCLMNYYAMLAR